MRLNLQLFKGGVKSGSGAEVIDQTPQHDKFGGSWNGAFPKNLTYEYSPEGLAHDQEIVDRINAMEKVPHRGVGADLLNGDYIARDTLAVGQSMLRRGGGVIGEDGLISEKDYSLTIKYKDGRVGYYSYGDGRKVDTRGMVGIVHRHGEGADLYGKGFRYEFDEYTGHWDWTDT